MQVDLTRSPGAGTIPAGPRRPTTIRVVALAAVLCGPPAWLAIRNGPIALAMLRGQDLAVVRLGEVTPSCDSSERASVAFRLTNLSLREVKLTEQPVKCMATYLEGLPTSIRPWASHDFRLVVHPDGRNGLSTYFAEVGTSSPRTPGVEISSPLLVRADEVRRYVDLGILRDGLPSFRRVVKIDNLPAADFLRVGPSLPSDFTVALKNAADRSLEIEITGKTPALPPGKRLETLDIRCDLYFRPTEVRRAKLELKAAIAGEWDLPEIIRFDPLSAPGGKKSIRIIQRPGDPSSRAIAAVEPIGAADSPLRATSRIVEAPIGSGEREYRVDLTTSNPDIAVGEYLKLRLIGETGESRVEIPVVFSGY